MAEPGGSTAFRALLRAYNEQPDDRPRIVAEIDRRFRRTVAILVVDTCGFVRRAHHDGIIPFLAHQERLQRLLEPVFARHGGRLLRTEADNFFAVFAGPHDAVACALAVLSDLAVANEALPAAEETEVSIGIGFGSVLDPGDGHLYGDEMNLAFKLGEDLAQPREVLLTDAARAALGPAPWQFEPRQYSVAGIHLRAHRLVNAAPPG